MFKTMLANLTSKDLYHMTHIFFILSLLFFTQNNTLKAFEISSPKNQDKVIEVVNDLLSEQWVSNYFTILKKLNNYDFGFKNNVANLFLFETKNKVLLETEIKDFAFSLIKTYFPSYESIICNICLDNINKNINNHIILNSFHLLSHFVSREKEMLMYKNFFTKFLHKSPYCLMILLENVTKKDFIFELHKEVFTVYSYMIKKCKNFNLLSVKNTLQKHEKYKLYMYKANMYLAGYKEFDFSLRKSFIKEAKLNNVFNYSGDIFLLDNEINLEEKKINCVNNYVEIEKYLNDKFFLSYEKEIFKSYIYLSINCKIENDFESILKSKFENNYETFLLKSFLNYNDLDEKNIANFINLSRNNIKIYENKIFTLFLPNQKKSIQLIFLKELKKYYLLADHDLKKKVIKNILSFIRNKPTSKIALELFSFFEDSSIHEILKVEIYEIFKQIIENQNIDEKQLVYLIKIMRKYSFDDNINKNIINVVLKNIANYNDNYSFVFINNIFNYFTFLLKKNLSKKDFFIFLMNHMEKNKKNYVDEFNYMMNLKINFDEFNDKEKLFIINKLYYFFIDNNDNYFSGVYSYFEFYLNDSFFNYLNKIINGDNVFESKKALFLSIYFAHKNPSNKLLELPYEKIQVWSIKNIINLMYFLADRFGEEHCDVQKIIVLLLSIENETNPKNFINVYKNMLKKREEKLVHNHIVLSKSISISAELMTYKKDFIIEKIINLDDVKNLKKFMIEEFNNLLLINKEFSINSMLQEYDFNTLIDLLDSNFIASLVDKKPEKIIEKKFNIIINKALELSNKSEKFNFILQLLLNLTTCPTGKWNAIEHSYRLLSADKVIDEATISKESLLEEFKNFLFEQLQKEKEVAINYVVNFLTSAKDPHDIYYVKGILDKFVGLATHDEKPSIDFNANNIDNNLLTLDAQSILDLFYAYFKPQDIINRVQYLFNSKAITIGNDNEDVTWKVIMATLYDEHGINKNYFIYDKEETPVGITPLGAQNILLALGFFDEVK